MVTGLFATTPEGNDKANAALYQGHVNEVPFSLTNSGIVFGKSLGIKWTNDTDVSVYAVDADGNYEAVAEGFAAQEDASKIVYENIYFNIDLVVYPDKNALTYEFIVYPGGNPEDITLNIQGGIESNVLDNGDAELTYADEAILASAPLAYQEDVSGNKKVINSNFNIENEMMGVETGSYEQAQVLTITYIQNVAQR